jgi:hypothetical protein
MSDMPDLMGTGRQHLALCNQLEAGLQATRCRLLDALLAEALASVDVAEMEAAA